MGASESRGVRLGKVWLDHGPRRQPRRTPGTADEEGKAVEGRKNPHGKNLGAVERTRTSTVLLPPAPQAGASASSATTALG